MRIPDDVIEEVKNATDVVALVGSYVNLKKKGSNFFGLCPFHQEKTPSFSVNAAKQIFHCFGCGRGGNVFSFIMEYENVNFVDAVKTLADKAGITIPSTGSDFAESQSAQLYQLNRAAAAEYHKYLFGEEGDDARSYLTSRGFSEEVIKSFALGLSPDAWEWIGSRLVSRGFQHQMVERAGLVGSKQGGGFYDRFRGRIIFPIVNESGKVVAFGGRVWRAQDDSPAKYINSPDTPVYKKGRVLYGLHMTKEDIRKAGKIVLVEGYTDMLSVHSAGVKNVAATSGTALTRSQALLAKRYAERCILLYDGDEAGKAAAARAAAVITGCGLDVRIAQLPDDTDPDSYAREEGLESLQKLIEDAVDYVDFRYSLFTEEQLGTPAARASAARKLVEELYDIEDELVLDLLVGEFAGRLKVDERLLRSEAAKMRRGRRAPAEPEAVQEIKLHEPAEKAEYQLGMLMLSDDNEAAGYARQFLNGYTFTHEDVGSVVAMILESAPDVDKAMYYNRLESPSGRALLTRMMDEAEKVKDAVQLAKESVETLSMSWINLKIANIREKIRQAESKGEDPVQLLEEHKSLVKERKELFHAGGKGEDK